MKESLNAAAEDAGLSGVVQLPGHGQDLPGPSADQQLGQPAAQPLGAVLVRAPDLGRRDPHALHLLVHPLLHPLRTLEDERSSAYRTTSPQTLLYVDTTSRVEYQEAL